MRDWKELIGVAVSMVVLAIVVLMAGCEAEGEPVTDEAEELDAPLPAVHADAAAETGDAAVVGADGDVTSEGGEVCWVTLLVDTVNRVCRKCGEWDGEICYALEDGLQLREPARCRAACPNNPFYR